MVYTYMHVEARAEKEAVEKAARERKDRGEIPAESNGNIIQYDMIWYDNVI